MTTRHGGPRSQWMRMRTHAFPSTSRRADHERVSTSATAPSTSLSPSGTTVIGVESSNIVTLVERGSISRSWGISWPRQPQEACASVPTALADDEQRLSDDVDIIDLKHHVRPAQFRTFRSSARRRIAARVSRYLRGAEAGGVDVIDVAARPVVPVDRHRAAPAARPRRRESEAVFVAMAGTATSP